jgi:lipase
MRASSNWPLFVSTFNAPALELDRETRPILALHGVEAHGLRFVGLAAHLPDTTIVAPDLRGHGRSPKHGPWTAEQHVRDVLPLLRRLGPRTIVLGHSYGGLIAWELARAAHDQLAALVLVDPAINIERDDALREQRAAAEQPRWPDAQTALNDLLTGRGPSAHWSVALDVAVGLARDPDGGVRALAAPEAVQAVWGQVAARLQPSSWRGPTLLLEAGPENGRFVSRWLVSALRRELGDRLQHVVLDVPHTIPADAPELLAEHVREFMARL